MKSLLSSRKPKRAHPPAVQRLLKRSGDGAQLARRALERGIEIDLTPKEYLKLTYRGETHRFKKGWSTLSTPIAVRCARQKEITSRLLRHRGFPAPENAVFAPGEAERAFTWAEPILPVAVKPHAANRGKLVHIGLKGEDDFATAFERVAREYGAVLVEEQIPGDDYRFSLVQDRVVGITRRAPAHVIGDSTTTVEDLIARKDAARRDNPVHPRIRMDDILHDMLEQAGYTLDDVPPEGETVWLRGAANVASGGEATEVSDVIAKDYIEMVEEASRGFPGLGIAGYDIMITGDPTLGDGQATILEVNPSPDLSPHYFPWSGPSRDVYGAVLDAMFPETSQTASSVGTGR